MCEFVSFVLTEDEKVFAGSLTSHEGIEVGWELKPGKYRECEWTEDDKGESLVVRVAHNDEFNETWYKVVVLDKFPTRKKLLEYLTIGKSNGATYYFQNGQLHREDGPAKECVDGSKCWYKNGQLHREGGPAEEGADGIKHWYKNGQRHREDGSALHI